MRILPIAVLIVLGLTPWALAATVTVALAVPGIACKSCAGDVQEVLAVLPGISGVRVDEGRRRVQVGYDPARVSVDAMLRALDDIGFGGQVASPPAERQPQANQLPPAHRPSR